MLCWVLFVGSFCCGTVSQALTAKMYVYFLWELMKLPLAAHFLLHFSHFCSARSHWAKASTLNRAESWSLVLPSAYCCSDSTRYILMSLNSCYKYLKFRNGWREGLKDIPSLLSFPCGKVQSCPFPVAGESGSSTTLHLWLSLQPRGKLHLCGSHSCWTLMGTCLHSFHWPPLATSPLKMTSCCLPVVSLVLDYRWEVGTGGGGGDGVLCVLSPSSFCILNTCFSLWLLPLYG